MPYTTLTLTQALQDLARRLNDPSGIFWTDAEKTLYLQEAVRCFNAAANYFRDQFTFDTTINVHWYDLTTVANTLRPQTVTDVDLFTEMEYHLLEPPTGATWTGSAQFTINDLLGAVQRRRDQLLFESGCHLQRATAVASASIVDTILDQTVIDIRRMAWLPDNTYPNKPLWLDDRWAQSNYQPRTIGTVGVPSTWRRSTEPPLIVSVNKIPPVTGNYEFITVNSGAVLSTSSPTVLTVPDDFAWVIKYGALADLLSRESVARDPMRAEYCQRRYIQGMALLGVAPAVLVAQLGQYYEDRPLQIDAVQSGDNYRPLWESEAAGTPKRLYTAGLNLFALAPKPANSTLDITLQVVENAPFPANGAEFFQVGREDYDVILDLAQHTAAFKQGGMEFASTLPLFNNFLRHVKTYNSKLNQMGEFTDIIYDQSQLQGKFFPVMQPKEVEE